ncbi:MAG: hypothetical protein JST26_08530 [Bacteroidetes bacterium]|nr:hypothetical protein [Bacteroidota bacterium]
MTDTLEAYPGFWTLVFRKLRTPSVFVFWAIVVFSALTFKFWINWCPSPFTNDVDQYYSYLVAKFIHNDLNFKFPHHYWLIEAPNGQLVPKVTMGMAIMYLPFFVIGNNIAYAFDYNGEGYSAPYMWCIHLGSILYVLIGLWYCRKTLLHYFSEWITALTMVLLLFGTNLFFYTYKESEMPHSYLFLLFSLFVYHVVRWQHSGRLKHVYIFAFIAGFISLIRPTECLVLLFPLLINVATFRDFKDRLAFLAGLKWKLLLIILLFIIPILPQLIFWKVQTGQFFFFSYGSQEGFFFRDPKFYSVLFGYRKGWLLYTPIMWFSVLGMVWMFFKWRKMFFAVTVYFLVNLYLISSWWDWGYGGAYGMRALVHSYALLVIPFAFFIRSFIMLGKQLILKIVSTLVILSVGAFFCYLTIFQTWMFKNSLMHWDSMTREAYWFVFLKKDFTGGDRVYLETLFKHPDYEAMRQGKRDE